MVQTQAVLKALSDSTRFKIIEMLLQRKYCVKAISRELDISESAVSQHIKLLKETGLLTGKKSGYYIHYSVNRDLLHSLASEIEALASIERDKNMSLECNCKDKAKCIKEQH